MTTHINELIKQLKEEGYQLTTAAALLNKKAPTEVAASVEGYTNIN